MVYVLMGKPRKQGEDFTDTAKSYLYGVAAERNITEVYRDRLFDEWLARTETETKAMKYGTETEELAKQCYAIALQDNLELQDRGFVEYIPGLYGDSPDGVIVDEKTKSPVGCLEVKCPTPCTWMKYKSDFAHGKTLKEIEDKYYWQCQSHMMCNWVDWCDFVFFDKMMDEPLQIVRIERNNDDIQLLQDRIVLAGKFIEQIEKQ